MGHGKPARYSSNQSLKMYHLALIRDILLQQ